MQLPIYPALLAGVLLLSACNVEDSPIGSGVDKGQSSISFTTSSDFAGATSVSITGGLRTSSLRQPGANIEQITLKGSELSGSIARTYQLDIEIPSGISTSDGNLIADFSKPDGEPIVPILSIAVTIGGTHTQTYVSEAGTLTITKLTVSEIEGKFASDMKDPNSGTIINLSNGKFYGRFK